jgi:exonuclease SbcC
MPFTIHARDFQSIRDASLDVSGLTVVTGTNNSGKTAMVRAFRGVFANARGTSFVRHGTNYSSVTVSFHGGPWVTWEKGSPSINRYLLDGLTLQNVSHGPPEEVRALGVRSVTLGDREVWPQIALQMSGPIFLLDAPGAIMAEAVSDVERVAQLNAALRACEIERKEEASAVKIRSKDLAQVRSQLGKMATFPKVREAFEEVEAAHSELVSLHSRLEMLLRLQAKHAEAQKEKSRLAKVRDISVSQFGTTFSELKTSRKRLISLQELSQKGRQVGTTARKLSGVGVLEVPGIPASFKETRERLKRLRSLETKLSEIAREQVSYLERRKSLEAEIQTLDKELEICPMCRRPR